MPAYRYSAHSIPVVSRALAACRAVCRLAGSRGLVLVTAAILSADVDVSIAQPPPERTSWADSARRLIDSAVLSTGIDDVDSALTILDRALAVAPNDSVLLHYKGYALYRKASIMQEEKRSGNVSAVLDEAAAALDASAKTLAWPETLALRSSVYGLMISRSGNPFTAMRLGPKSNKAIERAVSMGPSNPRVFLLRGIGFMYKPSMFGGGLDKAEKDLDKAIALFDADTTRPSAPAPSWGRSEAWAFLGEIYAKRNQPDSARTAYHRALALSPGYAWVKDVLLPALDQEKR